MFGKTNKHNLRGMVEVFIHAFKVIILIVQKFL